MAEPAAPSAPAGSARCQLPPFTATAVGSLPHTDAAAACSLIERYLLEVPAWPQLPRRSFREAIYAQFSAGFPGLVLDADHVFVDRQRDLSADLEQLYRRYLAADASALPTPPEYAAGLAHFLAHPHPGALAVKGQVIGPVSWGLTLTDQGRRAILYDDVLADALARHLRLQAAWQEQALRALSPQTILFIDEPYLAALGSAYVSVPRDQVLSLLDEVAGGLTGWRGVHCCGNTDWPLLLGASIDILNFDAYNYAQSLSLYPTEVRAFLQRGGRLAWGIVPVASDEAVLDVSPEALQARLVATFRVLASKGVPFDWLVASAMLTPACGMGTLSEAGATRALELLVAVARQMRLEYG